jgi:8-oxo-dGTP pyrophosphatase MutT (NUDIX family)
MEDDPAELLVVVDADDRVLEHRRRAEVHADRTLLHRSVAVLVDTVGGTLWQRRGFAKDTDPGAWDLACTGHVSAGDADVETAIRRELEEELGIAGEPVLVGRLLVELPEERELVAVYRLWHPGPFVVAPPEVAGLVVYPAGTRPEPLSPWSTKVLEWLAERPDMAPAERGGEGR